MNSGGNTTTIDQNANFFNMSNNVFNNTVTTITGLIPSQNLQCLVRTDSVVAVPGYAAMSGANITGNGSNNPYFNNFFLVGTSVNSSNISVTALNQINSSETLLPGSYMVSFIGTRFALGTYVTADLGTGNYSITPNALVSFAGKATTDYAYTTLNRPFTAAAAAATITLDYNTTTNIQCLNSSSLMLNAISIKGQGATSEVDIYGNLQLQGSFQYNYGGTISATGSLVAPLSQFYLISNTTAITITLPVASATTRGTLIQFKRYVSAGGIVTFNQTGGGSFMVGSASLITAASVTMPIATYQTSFISAGTLWLQHS